MRTRWSPLVPVVAACVSSLVLAAGSDGRLSLAGLRHVEAAARAIAWRSAPSAESLRLAFDGEVTFPLASLLAAVLGGGAESSLRLLTTLAAGLVVFFAAESARRAAGDAAALLAAAFLMATPSFRGAALDPSPTMIAVAAVGAAWLLAGSVRQRGSLVLPAALALAAALLSSFFAWWMLPAVAFALFARAPGQPPAPPGQVTVAPASAAMLALIPAALLLVLALHPWLHGDGLERLGSMLERALRSAPEPWLFDGELYGRRRMPAWAPLATWLRSTPSAVALLALLAPLLVRGTVRSVAGLLALLVWIGAGVVVLRSPYHAFVDHLAFGYPVMAALAGIAAAAAAESVASHSGANEVRRRVLAGMLGALVAGVALAETARFSHAPRAFYNTLAGGLPGAVDAGQPRYAHPALRPAFFDGLVGDGDAVRVAVVANAWEIEPILRHFSATGAIAPPVQTVAVAEAEWVVASFDDTLPEVYANLIDLGLALHGAGAAARVERVDGVALLVAIPLR